MRCILNCLPEFIVAYTDNFLNNIFSISFSPCLNSLPFSQIPGNSLQINSCPWIFVLRSVSGRNQTKTISKGHKMTKSSLWKPGIWITSQPYDCKYPLLLASGVRINLIYCSIIITKTHIFSKLRWRIGDKEHSGIWTISRIWLIWNNSDCKDCGIVIVNWHWSTEGIKG